MFSWLACTTLENQPHSYAKRGWLSRVVLFSILLCGLIFDDTLFKCWFEFWKSATLDGFGVFPSPYVDFVHAKTIGKQGFFAACLHHARQPVRFLCKKGLVVESGTVFYTTLWAHLPRTNRKTPRSLLQGRRFLGPPLFQ